MKGLIIVIAGVAVVALAVVSLDNRSGRPANSGPTDAVKPAKENLVIIQNYKFAPETLTIKKGATITWENRDNTRHNAVSEDDSPVKGLNGPLIGRGETWAHTFTGAGTYTYYCSPHPYMKARIVVTE